MIDNPQMSHEGHVHLRTRCICWSAIIVGSFVAVGLSFLLNVFGMSIGLSAFTNTDNVLSLAVGGFIGLLIGGIASFFFAGWLSGYLARGYCTNQKIGLVYGLATWCLSLILSIILATYASQFVAMTYQALFNPGVAVMNAMAAKSVEITGIASSKLDISTKMGVSLFLTFVLFFIGAISCCFGGYCGLKTKERL